MQPHGRRLVAGWIAIVFAVFAAQAKPTPEEDAKVYIGNSYMLLPTQTFASWEVSGAVGVVHVAHYATEMLWLEVMEKFPAPPGEFPMRRVVDVLVLPRDYKASGLEFQACRTPVPDRPAIAVLTKAGGHKEMRAWTVDLKTRRFVEIEQPVGTCSFIPGDD